MLNSKYVEEGEGSGMKRAAMLILTIATLLLIGSISTPVFQDSSCYASTTKEPGGAAVASTQGGTGSEGSGTGGSGSGGTGGTNEGDADGLSGIKVNSGGRLLASTNSGSRVWVFVEMWWKFMVWIR